MSQFDLVAQFTKDAFAKEDHSCEHPSCRVLIQKGDPCLYMATIDPTKQGHHVCLACYHAYQTRLGTMTCTRGSAPDPHKIHCAVNAAQHASAMPPPAAPTVQPNPPTLGMGPPPQGPIVHVPSAWRTPSNVSTPQNSHCIGILPGPLIAPPVVVGYSVHHAQYAAEGERWLWMAYKPLPAEKMSLGISAMYEGGNKRGHLHGTQFGVSHRDGMRDIDAHIKAPELVTIALLIIIPRIQVYCHDFPWHVDKIVVHDPSWVNLANHPDMIQPYFYQACFQTSSHKNVKNKVFKSKHFSLYVVISEAQWHNYENFLKKADDTSASSTSHANPFSAASQSPSGSLATFSQCLTDTSDPPFSMPLSTFVRPLDIVTPEPCSPMETVSVKHGYEYTSSIASITTRSPPLKRVSTVPKLCSPDCAHLKEALKNGGSACIDITKGTFSCISQPIQY
ncbi:hypothetical protein PAXRUDRAFT_155220 [Paxillus rubicundulus Ve08.2h10]|uniref:Uncharacterized protein n=1 Tax=Paxillus rubicundulus Ve08.2h10 TaxID=930991 RepID=A0A0D0CGF7_9AGAM|nr:hypothetical protein PAXRUDRAFT_155220 [Paxillus rubicundulus Ve08.2h10]